MWQREMPQQQGLYWARPKDWQGSTLLWVIEHPDGFFFCPEMCVRDKDGSMTEGTCWGGWWWSEPIPECPPPPDSDEAIVEGDSKRGEP